MSAQRVPIKSSIITRLLKIVFSFYLIVTVTVTLIHMGVEYTRAKESILKELQAFSQMFEPVLQQGLWRLDPLQWKLTVEGMITSPVVIGVKIKDEYKRVIEKNGMITNEIGQIVFVDKDGHEILIEEKTPLLSNVFEYHFIIKKDEYHLGEATLYSGNMVVYEKVKVGFGFIILNAIIKTFALWIFFLWIGRRILCQPLSDLSEAVEKIDLISLQKTHLDIHTGGKNEIWVLQNAFNFMLGKLSLSMQKHEQAEKEKNRLFIAIEQAAEEVIITSLDGIIQYVNPALENASGYSKEEIIDQHFYMLRDDRENYIDIQKEMNRAFSKGDVYKKRLRHRRKDGSFYEVSTRISPVRDETGIISNYVIVQYDISYEMELERRLQQAQKMEAIGTLAGGIAHDFNNILFPIIMYAEMTIQDVPEKSRANKNLKSLLEAARRAKELVQQILTFSRRKKNGDYRIIHLQPLIKESLKLLRASVPSTIQFNEDICTDCGPVMGDPTQIHQLIVNLCTNAYHAMREKGGELGIILESFEVTLEKAKILSNLKPGNYVKLTISDTGVGISQEVISRIFEPYFTTKGSGDGTGLGLSIVHGIVEKHKGIITVKSCLGCGTQFEVYLPNIKHALEIESPKVSNHKNPEGNEHILLVDDEEQVVEVEKEMLEMLGYQVNAQINSLNALKIFKNHPSRFDLIITDMTMPHMTGTVLATNILKIRPDIPIILCTGFSEAVTEEKAKSIGIQEFVIKPVATSKMARLVRQLLDSAKK